MLKLSIFCLQLNECLWCVLWGDSKGFIVNHLTRHFPKGSLVSVLRIKRPNLFELFSATARVSRYIEAS